MGINTKQGKQVDGTVTVEKTGQAPITESETIGDVASTQPMANVGYSVAMTKNLGNYESVKITASIHLPCLPTEQEIEDTYIAAKDWVEGKINQAMSELE